MTGIITVASPAKINIGLEVTQRRDDGYHELVTIMQAISLADVFEWTDTGKPFVYQSPPGIPPEIDLTARALATATDRQSWSGTLRVLKHIPVSAGLGGGSSNAAIALLIADPDADDATMHERASSLGSDVPFFLTGGTAVARGTGTDLTPQSGSGGWVVVLTPDIAIPSKTATLYRSLSVADFSDGKQVEAIANLLATGTIPAEQPPNTFTGALEAFEPVRQAREMLLQAGAPWVTVSGAGPSLYTLVADENQANAIADRIRPEEGKVFLARTVSDTRHADAARELGRRIRGIDGAR